MRGLTPLFCSSQPHRPNVSIKGSGLQADALRDELLELAKYGRVLVLLDACHSGATTMNGTAIALNMDALRTSLASANVTARPSCCHGHPARWYR